MCPDDALFEIIEDRLVFPEVAPGNYLSVFDFGCGCGRIARQLMCQDPAPERYVGIDIHRGMIEWCQNNLTPVSPAFTFRHHDVWNLGLGPDNTRQATCPFPAESGAFTLVIAHSVFTHIYKEQTEFYLAEIARILATEGEARTTWFFFDRLTFPMLFDFQVCLYVNEIDPTNAVIYDWKWFLEAVRRVGLRVRKTIPPGIRGHQWEVYLEHPHEGRDDSFPSDPAVLRNMCGGGVSGEPELPESVSAEEAVVSAPGPEIPSLEIPSSESPSSEAPISENPAPAERSGHRLRFTSPVTKAECERITGELDWWYHSYYFDNGFEVRGDYDIGADVAGYGFPSSMEGMSVLDIGTGAGWFAHYFEQLGADVTAIDARGYGDFDVYGRHDYPGIDPSARQPDRYSESGDPIYFSPVSRGFWMMKDLLGSKVDFRNARAYD
ncbi:MAG TPA: class I SAM-dependent methyltransferase, partial [Bryobacteraceae bacterium]|nr:class I SAM-dependent methyltransferase [Bryobacteraceae bacterium]